MTWVSVENTGLGYEQAKHVLKVQVWKSSNSKEDKIYFLGICHFSYTVIGSNTSVIYGMLLKADITTGIVSNLLAINEPKQLCGTMTKGTSVCQF